MYVKRMVLTGLCLLTVQNPVRTDVNPFIAGGCAIGGLLIGGAIGWGIAEHQHNSAHAKAQEMHKEYTIVHNAKTTLEQLKATAHPVLTGPVTYQRLTDLLVQQGAAGLESFTVCIQNQLQVIQEQQKNLAQITGAHGTEGQELAKKAREVSAEYMALEHWYQSWNQIIQQINTLRQLPLQQLAALQFSVTKLISHAVQEQRLIEFLRKEYGSYQSYDGVRGVPLVCAAEYIKAQQDRITMLHTTLVQHRALVFLDPEVDAALCNAKSWLNDLQDIMHTITHHALFKKEVEEHHIRKDMLLRSQAEKANAEAQRARAEEDRARAEADRLRESNRAKELEIQRLQAQSNMAHAVTNAVGAVAHALTGPTHHTCSVHNCDYYDCPHNCHRRREYIEVYVIRR